MFQRFWITLPVLLLAACAGSPSSSSSSAPSSSNPAAPTPAVSSITVNGSAPALGETTQFTATATLSNGTTQDVTAQAVWQSSDPFIAVVSSGGAVRAVAAGEADITAAYSGVTGRQHLKLAAAPTARRALSGVFTDDSTGRPITELAEAQIMDGENAGKAARVDANGAYVIPDVTPGLFTVRARATGYESRDHQVTLDVSDVRVDFALRAERRDVPCSYAVAPATLSLPYVAGQASVTITRTSGNCAWTVTSDANWLTLASTTGNGDATVWFAHEHGPFNSERSGVIRVDWTGGSASITIKQFGDRDPCVAGITANGQNPIAVAASGGQFTASIQVTAGIGGGCGPWTARAEPAGAVSFIGSTTGGVPGSLTFTLPSNTLPGTRTIYVVATFERGNPSAVLKINQAGTQ